MEARKKANPFGSLSASKWAFLGMLVLMCALTIVFANYILEPSVGLNHAPYREYVEGELSDEDIIATKGFSFIDDIATEEKRDKAVSSVLPIFYYDLAATIEVRNKFSEFEKIIRESGDMGKYFVVDGDDDDYMLFYQSRVDSMTPYEQEYILSIARECFTYLLSEGVYDSSEIEEITEMGKSQVNVLPVGAPFLHSGEIVESSSVITEQNIFSRLMRELATRNYGMDSVDETLITSVIAKIMEPNVRFDRIMTQAAMEEAASSVAPQVIDIEPGDYIFKRDMVVTAGALRILDHISGRYEYNYSAKSVVIYPLFTIAILAVFMYYVALSVQYEYRRFQYLAILLTGILASLILAIFIIEKLISVGYSQSYTSVLPFYFMPLFATYITGKRRIGFLTAMVLSSFTFMIPVLMDFTFLYVAALSMVMVARKRNRSERIELISHALFSVALITVTTVILSWIYTFSIRTVVIVTVIAIINVVASFILIAFAVPLIERIFNIPTIYRLDELGKVDAPVLRMLSQVAPGTFNHSKNVSDMAYSACMEIGLDANLARVGGLYHDIGKTEHPEYFVENQSADNVHDDMTPNLSAAVIKSHVKIGAEKGKDIGLPKEIVDIIYEHHGNDIIRYFYNLALKENGDDRSKVREEDFRYSSNIPQTPESAVVMLADCSEAATRTLKNPNVQKYDKFITTIITEKIEGNQLNDSGLTISDLERIKGAFIRYLIGRDHHRISYNK